MVGFIRVLTSLRTELVAHQPVKSIFYLSCSFICSRSTSTSPGIKWGSLKHLLTPCYARQHVCLLSCHCNSDNPAKRSTLAFAYSILGDVAKERSGCTYAA